MKVEQPSSTWWSPLYSLLGFGLLYAVVQFTHYRADMREITPAQYVTLARYVEETIDPGLNALINAACQDGKIISREHVPMVEHIMSSEGFYQIPYRDLDAQFGRSDARMTLCQSMKQRELPTSKKCSS
ncbi:MAG: hypothetical protein ACR2PS_07975 [Pseudomonadales bacterium]